MIKVIIAFWVMAYGLVFQANALHREYFAHCNYWGYLDGQRQGSLGGRGINADVDAEGNVYYLQANYYGNIRCVLTNGRVITITGNEYYLPDFSLTEGPASALAPLGPRIYIYAAPEVTFMIVGVPVKGEGHGAIYARTQKGEIVKIWKRADNGRWWFKRVVGGGPSVAPTTHGSVISGLSITKANSVMSGPHRSIIVFANSGLFRLDTASGQLTCLCGKNDYFDAGRALISASLSADSPPNEAYVDSLGAFYINWYSPAIGGTVRVSPGLDSITLFCKDNGDQKDGPVETAGFFCGPQVRGNRNMCMFLPAACMTNGSQDEASLRRIYQGRISTLCLDGEWREFPGGPGTGYCNWFYLDVTPGPNNTAYTGYMYSLTHDLRLYKITDLDFSKPTK